MTDVQPNDPNRDQADAPDLKGEEVEAGRQARKTGTNVAIR
jgi:hypothetical protein